MRDKTSDEMARLKATFCFTQILQGSAYCQIWAKLLQDESYAVGLYNAVSHVDTIAGKYQREYVIFLLHCSAGFSLT